MLLNQVVFQASKAGFMCSGSESVELHIAEGCLR